MAYGLLGDKLQPGTVLFLLIGPQQNVFQSCFIQNGKVTFQGNIKYIVSNVGPIVCPLCINGAWHVHVAIDIFLSSVGIIL